MTGLVYICIATLLIALAPVLAKKGIRKSKPAIGAAFAATALTVICIFLNKGAWRGLNVAGWGMWTWIYVLLSGLTTAFCILFLFKSAVNGLIGEFFCFLLPPRDSFALLFKFTAARVRFLP